MAVDHDNKLPLQYVGGETANLDYHHGQLRPVVGVQNRQVLRANRSHPEWSDGFGWTYNHAPMLAWWQGTFFMEYLSNPVGEHVKPGQSFLVKSQDGIRWSKPWIAFPVYRVEKERVQPNGRVVPAGNEAVMHQRMGFYLAPNGKMLVLGFYAICVTPKEKPVDGMGIGRVVREMSADGELGPIYFIRYNRHAGWDESNTNYPYYRASSDQSFVAACEALLSDKLVTFQWWEEEKSNNDAFFPMTGHEAFNWYKRKDGKLVGLWKWSKAALSEDGGQSWSEVQRIPSLIMAGGKMWGEQTSDGKYALLYNPSPQGNHRWPLALLTSEDGETFDHMTVVNGEVPPRRYFGEHKNYGNSYTRGIEASDGPAPRASLWAAYSANKEDLWISEIPVPIRWTVEEHVSDRFEQCVSGGPVTNWNIYSSEWAQVSVIELSGSGDKGLMLEDQDPVDYAKAARVFPERSQVTVRFTLMVDEQAVDDRLFIDIRDRKSAAPVRLMLDGSDGQLKVLQKGAWLALGAYPKRHSFTVELRIDTNRQGCTLSADGIAEKTFMFTSPAFTVERIEFCTKQPERRYPNTETPLFGDDLANCDEPAALSRYYVKALETEDSCCPIN